jgi:hypothetical protein
MAGGDGIGKSGSAKPTGVKSGISGPVNESSVVAEISRLDKKVGSDNYLPLYELRQSLEAKGISRNEQDNLLYALQRSDRIELSSLHSTGSYTPAQLSAGIMQNNGGALFFVSRI